MTWPAPALDRSSGRPLLLQLADHYAVAVAEGSVPLGARLPSERDLAGMLGVSRSTVVAAYRELERRGVVRGSVGRGTFVVGGGEGAGTEAPFAWRGKMAAGSRALVDPGLRGLVSQPDERTLSLGAGAPALDAFPLRALQTAFERVLAAGAEAALGLAPSEGHPVLREALARRARLPREQIVVVSGAQQGLDLVIRCLIDPGDVVVMDRPGYIGAIQAFRAANATVVGWDAGAWDMGELDELLRRHRPKLLYTNPTFHNPTGRTLPLARRQELLGVARRHRVPVVEDEPYRDLHFAGTAPPPSLHELDAGGGLVIGVRTFSKTLAAGLRLGWIQAPGPVAAQLATVKSHCDVFGNAPTQLAIADLLHGGLYDRHVIALRAEHERRHAALMSALARRLPKGWLSYGPAEGGLYLWARLRADRADGTEVQAAAARAGVSVLAGRHFSVDDAGRSHIRLCFTRLAPADHDRAVSRLARALDRPGADPRGPSRLEPAV